MLVWDSCDTPDVRRTLLSGHARAVEYCDVSGDGQTFLGVGNDGRVLIHSAYSNRLDVIDQGSVAGNEFLLKVAASINALTVPAEPATITNTEDGEIGPKDGNTLPSGAAIVPSVPSRYILPRQ